MRSLLFIRNIGIFSVCVRGYICRSFKHTICHPQRRCRNFEKRNNALTETFREHAYACLLRKTAIAMMKTGSRFSTDMLKLSAQTGAQRSQPCVQKQQRAHCVRQVWSFSQSLLLLLLLFVSHLLTFALSLTSPSSWACFPAVVSTPSAAINKHCYAAVHTCVKSSLSNVNTQQPS